MTPCHRETFVYNIKGEEQKEGLDEERTGPEK